MVLEIGNIGHIYLIVLPKSIIFVIYIAIDWYGKLLSSTGMLVRNLGNLLLLNEAKASTKIWEATVSW